MRGGGRALFEWGIDRARSNRDRIDRWAELGLLFVREDCLVPTLEGLAVADSLAAGLGIDQSEVR